MRSNTTSISTLPCNMMPTVLQHLVCNMHKSISTYAINGNANGMGARRLRFA
jgi:hypothetical protein